MILPRASLKRSVRTRTRKNATSADTGDIVCSYPSAPLVRRKTRPPPLQLIPELSENELDIDAIRSPATARPMDFIPQQLEPVSSRITLSAYTFSIDDALLIFGGDTPRSPALSVSSSTSSEDVLATPGASDDDDGCDFVLPTPRLRPQHISIRPLCITKTRSMICQEDEDVHNCFAKEENMLFVPVTGETPEDPTETKATPRAIEEAEQDFYAREFEDFISLSPTVPSPTSAARRDSLILAAGSLPCVVKAFEPKPRGRSRHSKPLPLLPPITPPMSTFPSISSLPLVQKTAQKSVVRRKRSIQPFSTRPSPPAPVSRPLPRSAVPFSIKDSVFSEENLDASFCGPIVAESVCDMEEVATIYSRPSFTYTASANPRALPPAILETPLSGMYGDVILPRSSTDSGAPRSSTDSTSSASSTSSDNPSSLPSSPTSEQRLRSRWSSSTLGSIVLEPPRSTKILSPLRNVARRVLPPSQKMHPLPKAPQNKRSSPATSSSPRNTGKQIRRQGSRSSTSSAGTSSSDRDSRDGSPNGLRRRHIPMATFLRSA